MNEIRKQCEEYINNAIKDWDHHYGSFRYVGDDTYIVTTGGWSENEYIINKMQENFVMWTMCWFQSQRGGRYIFKLPYDSNRKPVSDSLERFHEELGG